MIAFRYVFEPAALVSCVRSVPGIGATGAWPLRHACLRRLRIVMFLVMRGSPGCPANPKYPAGYPACTPDGVQAMQQSVSIEEIARDIITMTGFIINPAAGAGLSGRLGLVNLKYFNEH